MSARRIIITVVVASFIDSVCQQLQVTLPPDLKWIHANSLGFATTFWIAYWTGKKEPR